jgi:hypothetical protein
MPGEHINPSSGREPRSGLHLFPCAVISGVEAPQYDDRLQNAQSALNRIQVWLGDIFIDLAAKRRRNAGPPPNVDQEQDNASKHVLPALRHFLTRLAASA